MKKLLIAAALVVGLTGSALAQDNRVHVRGTIAALDGNVLTVTAPVGGTTTKIALAPNYTVQYVVKTSLSSITPGSWVGAAALPQPDGSLRAIEVHIFPPGSKVGAGSRPYDLAPTSTMTNGNVDTIGATKVDSVSGSKLTISYEGGAKEITVLPTTPVVMYAPATAAAVVPGAHVNMFAVKAADGSLSATGLSVGKDGLVPPL
jgi:hypothetical protein